MDHGATEHLTSSRVGDVSRVQKASSQLYTRNLPLLHFSRYVISHDQLCLAFPTFGDNLAQTKQPCDH